MPFFKASGKLVYYAHVPKCGGSAVADYLSARFGGLAFHDNAYLGLPEAARWTRSSPQHVDAASLARLIPADFFDACFTIVRHPEARAVSTFHFQQDLEKSIPAGMGFSDWLTGLESPDAANPFRYDNHTRPMAEIVPPEATVFHMEHGLDALILWCDALTGNSGGPRAINRMNRQGEYAGTKAAKAVPDAADQARLARIYAVDFARFGYEPGRPAPKAAAPDLSAGFIAERDRALHAMNTPLSRLRRKIARRIGGR